MLYCVVHNRFLESHWFVWVTQSNHIPMEVNLDQNEGWVEMQVSSAISFYLVLYVPSYCLLAEGNKKHGLYSILGLVHRSP